MIRTMILGGTGLPVTKPAFGALPIQRTAKDEAVPILRQAYEAGIRYFDTANAYTDSEEKLGLALADVRGDVVISTKSLGRDHDTVARHIQLSLERLRTDYIDLFQFHQVSSWQEIDSGAWDAAQEAKAKGWIRHIGVTCHSLAFAREAVASGRFETLQYPFSYLSNDEEQALVRSCLDAGMGFIAMKALAGGLLANARAVHAFMAGQEGVVPIYGIQTMEELNEWLALAEEDPALDDGLQAVIDQDRAQLGGQFCRLRHPVVPSGEAPGTDDGIEPYVQRPAGLPAHGQGGVQHRQAVRRHGHRPACPGVQGVYRAALLLWVQVGVQGADHLRGRVQGAVRGGAVGGEEHHRVHGEQLLFLFLFPGAGAARCRQQQRQGQGQDLKAPPCGLHRTPNSPSACTSARWACPDGRGTWTCTGRSPNRS